MDYWFFFSYAHADSQDNVYLQQFYDDLAEGVRVLTGDAPKVINFLDNGKPGFIDREGISLGAMWDPALMEGLNTCKAFVPLYSPSYFRSEYCGKEFAVFWDRMNDHLKQIGAPTSECVILPVLWTPEENVKRFLPPALKNIQYTHGAYPEEYLKRGAMQLRKLAANERSEFYTAYTTLIGLLADSIVDAASRVGMPTGKSPLPALSAVNATFAPGASSNKNADEGPRRIQFIFVAASLDEIKTLKNPRQETKFYGKNGGSDWLPYLDVFKGDASKLAIDVIETFAKNSQYEEIPLTKDTKVKIEQAVAQGNIVVLVVDTWTLQLPKYIDLVAPLDPYFPLNCITVIAWNETDDELLANKSMLQTAVEGVFKTKVIRDLPDFKSTPIKSYETFKEELIKALHQARKDIFTAGKIQERLKKYVVKQSAEKVTQAEETFTNYSSVTL